ncbi:hypothetical protein EDB84DRAFT_1533425 [Lactarius hengduanensis]|nr:hypothetical protein EDB84DRAFT_1533425 [Lactarius hengduanensis]
MQHHTKLLKYPTRDEVASEQGIGPHFDAVLTFRSPSALALSSESFPPSVGPLGNQ